jgi:hypothetical protein
MSHFSELLSTAFAADGRPLREIAAATSIDHSALSRMMSGKLVPSRDNLEKLFSKFQPSTMVGHELVFAHLRDEAAAAGLAPDELSIRLRKGDDWRDKLPAGLLADLDLLASEAVTNSDFSGLISQWAAVIRGHHAREASKVHRFPTSEKKLPRGRSQETTA